MTERELKMGALKAVTVQYLHTRDGLVDIRGISAISAGELTIEALAARGLMEVVYQGRMFGRWTVAGKNFECQAAR